MWKKDIINYYNYVIQNRTANYDVSFSTLPHVDAIHKWVGAQYYDGFIYAIPNDMNVILKYKENKNFYLGEVGDGLFKWTGGCIWNGYLYCFSRTNSNLLKISLINETIEYVKAIEQYSREHHYGGICTTNGIVYQPPRDSDHILVWNLNTENTRKIYLNTHLKNKLYRYCGSILHPNGYVYFLPETGEKIIKLDIKTEEWSFIDQEIDGMVFDAKVAADGNIYGYSAYCQGILKIDVEKNVAKMIHKEIQPGAYGTKTGINGHLYSIPGDGEQVWDYDPLTDTLKSIYQFSHSSKAKYAGGATMKNGNICAVPAQENQLFQLKVNYSKQKIPDNIYYMFFVDCY